MYASSWSSVIRESTEEMYTVRAVEIDDGVGEKGTKGEKGTHKTCFQKISGIASKSRRTCAANSSSN